ncbi:MAG: acyltransferase [Bdellovibrio sp.]|nr:acyltransferase [Bdellovibrio sp.]
MTAQSASRVYFLDYAKAFVTALVVAQHVAFAYTTYASYYPPNYILSSAPVIDPTSWFGINLFEDFNDKFFMSLMFFIAGFFTFKSVQTKGLGKYIWDRVLRLGIPFAFVAFFMAPASYLPAYRAVGGTADYINYWFHDFLPLHWLPGPVWFIWVLLSFSILGSMLVHFQMDFLIHRAERWAKLRNHPYRLLAGAFFLCGIVYLSVYAFLTSNGPESWFTLGGPLWCQKNRIQMYFLIFFFGLVLGAGDSFKKIPKVLEYQSKVMSSWPKFLILALLSHFVMVYIENGGFSVPLKTWIWVPLFITTCLCASLSVLGFFCRNLYRKNRFWDFLARNAYTVYLIHYLIVVWIQYAFLDFEWHAAIKFATVTSLSLVASWGLAPLIRRAPLLNRIL